VNWRDDVKLYRLAQDADINTPSFVTAQDDLLEPLARFEPQLVKMAPSDEPAED
jgi:hypothetical protein